MSDSYVNWKGWQAADFGSFTQEQALYYAAELKKSGISALVGLRVGELGFGNGGFAGWVQREGGQWVGREVILLLRQRALHAGYEITDIDASFADAFGRDSFDLIVAFDVLEHLDIDGIKAFLLECKAALKSGGTIIFRVPSGDSPFSGAIYRGDLTHRTLLGSSAVYQLAEDAGLKLYQIRSPVLPLFGLGSRRAIRRLCMQIAQRTVFSFIRNFIMSNPTAVISPNMIVVFRKETLDFEDFAGQ